MELLIFLTTQQQRLVISYLNSNMELLILHLLYVYVLQETHLNSNMELLIFSGGLDSTVLFQNLNSNLELLISTFQDKYKSAFYGFKFQYGATNINVRISQKQ